MSEKCLKSLQERLYKELTIFFKFYQFDLSNEENKLIFKKYYSRFQDLNIDKVILRLNTILDEFIPRYKGHVPSIPEILKPLENSEGEIAWIRFKKLCFERYAPMPNDVYTICKIIGRDKLDNCTKEEFNKWIKKEFLEVYKDYQAGMYEELEDPKKEIHKQLESGKWITTFKPDWSAIKAVLKK